MYAYFPGRTGHTYRDGPLRGRYGAWHTSLFCHSRQKLHARETIPDVASWELFREIYSARWSEDGEEPSHRREAKTGRNTDIKSRGEQVWTYGGVGEQGMTGRRIR